MQRCNDLASACECGALFLLLLLVLGVCAHGAPQSANYKKQFALERSPDDVAFTKPGGVAVVRASQHYPGANGPQGSADEIAVVNLVDGTRLPFLPAWACTPSALTQPFGAADLVAASPTRAVLIGQRHWDWGSGLARATCVNVIDVANAYGTTGPQCLLSWTKPGAGFASDLAITSDGCFAVVNHLGWISVFRIDGASIPVPFEFDTAGSNPTRQQNSIAVTRSELPASPVKCVVVTARDVGGIARSRAYVLDLSDATPALEAELEINASNPQDDNPPHDVRLIPDESLAVVSADGVVALIDLSVTPAVIRGEHRDVQAERDYDSLTDSLVVTDTQVVALSSERGHISGQWRADVFDIAPGDAGGLAWKRSETGVGRPHDLERSFDGDTVVIRTQESIVVLDDIDGDAAAISRFDFTSPSGPLNTFAMTHDTLVVSRAWVQPAVAGQPGGPRHYAAALAHDLDQGVPATRVEVLDLTPLSQVPAGAPALVLAEVLCDPLSTGIVPASIQLHPGGRTFVVRCNAAPHDVDPDDPPRGYLAESGEDVWYFSLAGSPASLGSVFQYEMSASPRSTSQPLDVSRFRAVNISSHFSVDTGDLGFVHTVDLIE